MRVFITIAVATFLFSSFGGVSAMQAQMQIAQQDAISATDLRIETAMNGR